MNRYLLLFALIVGCKAQPEKPWEYLGQSTPGTTPEMFAPANVSTGNNERDIAISPDGTEIYYSLVGVQKSVIVMRKYREGRWEDPVIASFSGNSYDIEPAFSPDGSKLYFASRRSLTNGGPDEDFDIWYVEKQQDGSWTEAKNMGAPVNSDGHEYYPSVVKSGNLYFTLRLEEGGMGGEDIVLSRFENGKFMTPEPLDSAVNSSTDEYNAFVDPDEQFIIFGSWQREGSQGGGDLYISRKGAAGTWQPAVNMGDAINSPRLDYCPYVSPDGQWLFFTSEKVKSSDQTEGSPTYEEFVGQLNSPGNGRGDIYWVRMPVSEK
ncbi:hypothetical protein [uncultured Imperialibacter sp.]|uniref:hypothetical protein n=1 Tax=uncultured Imperialibacter sp. TaxID=1672639 RepID=UPI0030D94F2D|tara:strand:- start:5338 stop:6300 length:963 start_codon:yes stop_codon:yes gene_type:complete